MSDLTTVGRIESNAFSEFGANHALLFASKNPVKTIRILNTTHNFSVIDVMSITGASYETAVPFLRSASHSAEDGWLDSESLNLFHKGGFTSEQINIFKVILLTTFNPKRIRSEYFTDPEEGWSKVNILLEMDDLIEFDDVYMREETFFSKAEKSIFLKEIMSIATIQPV